MAAIRTNEGVRGPVVVHVMVRCAALAAEQLVSVPVSADLPARLAEQRSRGPPGPEGLCRRSLQASGAGS